MQRFKAIFGVFAWCFLGVLNANDVNRSNWQEDHCGWEAPLSCFCESCIPYYGEVTFGVDNFRSIPEGSWDSNTGAFASFNLALPITRPWCQRYGVQVGGSVGVYDWSGRGSALEGNLKESQVQTYLTGGFFEKNFCCSGINWGVVYDWQFNKNAGVFALNPNLSQLRFQAGYQFNLGDEFGLWGTVHTNQSVKTVAFIPIKFRAMNQINLFWRHDFSNYAQTMVWAGLPYDKSLITSSGRPGKCLFGASFSVPLTCCLSIDGHAMYMRARSSTTLEYQRYASNICVGLTYTFGGPRDCGEDRGALRPYLPVANNSNFIVDTNEAY